jgi:hypothetical protein
MIYEEEDTMVMPSYLADIKENPAVTGILPEGYMTSEEFRRRAIIKVNNFCKANGIL